MSAHAADPQAMSELFSSRDNAGKGGKSDYRISLGLKIGILLGGNDKMPGLEKARQDLVNYIGLALNSESGIVEIDGKDISSGRPEEEIFRFDGALDTLSYILDSHLRRFFKADSAESKMLFSSISQAAILAKLNKEEDFSAMSRVYEQILSFITALPIASLDSKDPKVSTEQGAVMHDCFIFIHKFFLEFDSKQDGKPALLNLLQLTSNNCLDLGVSVGEDQIVPLSNSYIRDTVCEMPQLQGVIPNDMKMVCNDIIASGQQ